LSLQLPNSGYLGACYRTLGRIDEAEAQFQLALSFSPELTSAMFNLGLVYQQKGKFEKAIEYYENVTVYADRFPESITAETLLESQIRECDLKQILLRFQDALECWKLAAATFHQVSIVFHELGLLQAQVTYIPFVEIFRINRFLKLLHSSWDILNRLLRTFRKLIPWEDSYLS
jgi:tetratricopeptide (TPR) repeat protein